MPSIPVSFFNEDVNYTLKDKTKIKNWLNSVIKAENKELDALNFIFCSDEHLYQMNVKYLNHDTYTDVITFDNSEPKSNLITGDIFISIDRVKDNAKQFNSTTHKELCRVLVHGTLHLAGYFDKTKKQKEEMTQKEDFYLNLLN